MKRSASRFVFAVKQGRLLAPLHHCICTTALHHRICTTVSAPLYLHHRFAPLYLHHCICTTVSAPLYLHHCICTTVSAPPFCTTTPLTTFRLACVCVCVCVRYTAVECSLQDVFVGDSEGYLHLYNAELEAGGQLHRLVWHAKVR